MSQGSATPSLSTPHPRAALTAPGTPETGRAEGKTRHTQTLSSSKQGPRNPGRSPGQTIAHLLPDERGRFPARLGMSFPSCFQAFPPGVPSHIKEWMASSSVPGQGWPGTAEESGPGCGKFMGLPFPPWGCRASRHGGLFLGKVKAGMRAVPPAGMDGDQQHAAETGQKVQDQV